MCTFFTPKKQEVKNSRACNAPYLHIIPRSFHQSTLFQSSFIISKGLVAGCHSFLFIFQILSHTYIHIHSIIFVQYIYPSAFAEASLHFLIACMLSGEDLPVVPSRESNSGLPYSKPTRCQLSHAAPQLSHAAPN